MKKNTKKPSIRDTRRKNNFKKKTLPVLIVLVLIVLIIIITGITALIKKYTPSKERQDLSEYYGLTSADQVAVILNSELMEYSARLIDGHVYVDYDFVHDTLNPRFYWDENENKLLYTTSRDLIMADADSSSYVITKSSVDYGRPVVKATSDSAYIDLDFVSEYSDFTYEYIPEPRKNAPAPRLV